MEWNKIHRESSPFHIQILNNKKMVTTGIGNFQGHKGLSKQRFSTLDPLDEYPAKNAMQNPANRTIYNSSLRMNVLNLQRKR